MLEEASFISRIQIVLTLLVYISFINVSRSLAASKDTCATNNYIEYHKKISQAIVLSLDGKYHESSRNFAEAFDNFDYKFSCDLLIAAQVCVLAKDSIAAKNHVINSLKNGVSLDRVSMIPLLRGVVWRISTLELDSVKQLNSFDQSIHLVIDSLFNLDQYWRGRNEKPFSNKYKTLNRRLKSRWNLFLKSAMSAIDSISDVCIFPSERVIGIGSNYLFLHSGNLYSMLYHYEYAFSRLKRHLDKALHCGYIHARQYALICDFERRHCIVNSQCEEYNDYVYGVRWAEFEIEDSRVKRYNENREKIGILPYEYELKLKIAQNTFNYLSNKNKNQNRINYFYYDL